MIVATANKDSFISCTVCIPFISFYRLIALATVFSMMLKSSGERRYPFLVHDRSCLKYSLNFSTYLLKV